MKPDGQINLLQRFPAFRTSDPDELRHVSTTMFGAKQIDLKNLDGFEARVNLAQLTDIGLAFGATSAELAVDHVAADFIRVQFALNGRATTAAGGISTEIDTRQHAVTSSDIPSRMVCEAHHHRLTLRLTEQALSRTLTTLLGMAPKGGFGFDPAIAADQPSAQGLFALVRFFAEQLDSAAVALPAPVCRELESSVQIAFLHASRHAFSDRLQGEETLPSARVVRQVEELIEARWQDAITIDRLAAETGVGARAIFRAFERMRGRSPIAFAKAVRLRHAREMLMSGAPDVSVSTTAMRCNFSNLGHFAREYRDAFGERPSETIARARR